MKQTVKVYELALVRSCRLLTCYKDRDVCGRDVYAEIRLRNCGNGCGSLGVREHRWDKWDSNTKL